MAKHQQWQWIPTQLSLVQFDQFVLPHLIVGRRGPTPKLSLHAIFNYTLPLLYMGCQWKELPIEKDWGGRPEIHCTRIYRMFRYWHAHGCFDLIFTASVAALHAANLLDTSVIHGDRGEKRRRQSRLQRAQESQGRQVRRLRRPALQCDRAVRVGTRQPQRIAAVARRLAAGHAHRSRSGFSLRGSIVSLDGVYDYRQNRKAIFNRGMTPNINPNPRGRKTPRRGRMPLFDPAIFEERFRTIERVFAWEDKFRRLLLRFERISALHSAVQILGLHADQSAAFLPPVNQRSRFFQIGASRQDHARPHHQK